jgi:hypothetical protein
LVGTFYYQRWRLWLEALQSALAAGQAIDVEAIRAQMRENDLAWTRQHETHPATPAGDTIAVSRRLFQKYSEDAADKALGAAAN